MPFTIRAMALGLACATALPPAASAAEADAETYIRGQIASISATPEILSVLKAGNIRHGQLDEAAILNLDAAWRAEIGTADGPVIGPVLNSSASDSLRVLVEASGGRIVEIIVMDRKGLNAAISNITSDYWQGDEAKFIETYPKGANAVFADAVEFDESTNIYQQQVSATLTNPDSGEPIGAVTFGLDAGAFN